MQLFDKDNIDKDFYDELTKIFISLKSEQRLDLETMILEPDYNAPGPMLFLLGAYYESVLSPEMFRFYYLAMAASYFPAFHRLSTIAYSKKLYTEGDNYLLAAISKNDREAMILLGCKYRLIDHNYQLAEKYFLQAKSYEKLGDLYLYYYDKSTEARRFYLEGVLQDDINCYFAFINNYIELLTLQNRQHYEKQWETRKNVYLFIAQYLEKQKDYKSSIEFYKKCYNLKNAFELNCLHDLYIKFGMNKEFYIYLSVCFM